MRFKNAWASVAGFGLVFVVLCAPPAQASVFIHEILADPPLSGGDANGDGVVSSTGDEFVELYNDSGQAVNISEWEIFDAVQLRHCVADDTWIAPYGLWVVFGGLGLNNGGDTVWLYDDEGFFVDKVSYGTDGGQDQSLTRSPQREAGAMVLHTQLDPDNRFSPGAFVCTDKRSSHAVPEFPTWTLVFAGITGFFFLQRCMPRSAFPQKI